MINSVNLSGRLTKDVQIRTTQSGVQVARLTLAVTRSFKNQAGEYEADFINCVAFRKTAETAAQYTKKGDLCNVHGRLQTRNFENQQGEHIFMTEVVIDEIQLISTGRGKGEYSQNAGQGNTQQNNTKRQQNEWQRQNRPQNDTQSNPFNNADEPIDINDEDLPF